MIGGIADILAKRDFCSEGKVPFTAEDGRSGFAGNAHFVWHEQFIGKVIAAAVKILQQGGSIFLQEEWASGSLEVMLQQPVSGRVLYVVVHGVQVRW